jgi:hypothetical protein
MAKWALWAAHRYLQPGAAAPRTVGRDGRPLRRAWREVSSGAAAAAQLARAGRRQPWWPRPLGLSCIGMACVAAVVPPVASHVAASASARPGGESFSYCRVVPGGDGAAAPSLRWRSASAGAPFTVVLLDAGYREVVRHACGDASAWTLDPTAAELVAQGAAQHWYVLGDRFGRPAASPVQALAIP